MASQKKFFKKNRIFLPKISILGNKKNFPGKTPVGISSYICLRNPYAKFEPNRMDSLGDRLFWHPQIQVQKTQTRARSRGPTQPRNLLYRIEIPAPSGKRLRGTGHLAYVVEGHASACPRTVGVDASRGALTLEIGGISSKFK